MINFRKIRELDTTRRSLIEKDRSVDQEVGGGASQSVLSTDALPELYRLTDECACSIFLLVYKTLNNTAQIQS